MAANTTRLAVDAERRVRRAWQEDGLDELIAGAFALTAALALGAAAISPAFLGAFPTLCLVALVAYLTLFARLKARLARPRTGHVRLRRTPVHYLSSAIVILIGVIGMADPLLDPRLAGPDLGVINWWLTLAFVAAIALHVGRSTGLGRFYLYALLPPAVEIAGRLADLDEMARVVLFLLVAGLTSLVAGAAALRGYLRSHPLPAGE